MKKKNLKEKASYYDKVELEKAFDFKHATIIQPSLKKVNINISEQQIELASRLGTITGNGYQNMLKTAISIGLKSLENSIMNTTRN